MEPEVLIEKLVPTLLEDEHLLAVHKPAGIDATKLPGRGAPGLAELLAKLRGRSEVFHLGNRLTRYESGVLLLGKHAEIARHIRAGLKTMRINQEYVALARGRMARPRIKIDAQEGASRGRDRDSRPGRSRGRAGSALPRADRSGNSAPTIVTRLRQSEGRVLLGCRTAVPNTHSLRAQLRSVHLRLLDDGLADVTRRRLAPALTCLHLLKISFFHPGLRRKITIRTEKGDEHFSWRQDTKDGETPTRNAPVPYFALRAALVRRLPLIVEQQTDSYRLFCGEVEDAKGLVAEKFGPVVILQIAENKPALFKARRELARWYRNMLEVDAVYVKQATGQWSGGQRADVRRAAGFSLRGSSSAKRFAAEISPRGIKPAARAEPLVGKAAAEQIAINEHGLSFAIKPGDGLAAGLFLDQRENRTRVRALSKDKDVLNLFAYTCGFSVAAAAGGARETVSVDISPKHLEWGRANFALNGLVLDNHQFIRSDAADYFKRANRQGKRFDLIVLDPPTFSHGRTGSAKQSFSVSRDLSAVIGGAVSLLRPGGILMVSTNYRRITKQTLGDRLREGAAGRPHRVIETPELPADFSVDPEHAKTIFARFA